MEKEDFLYKFCLYNFFLYEDTIFLIIRISPKQTAIYARTSRMSKIIESIDSRNYEERRPQPDTSDKDLYSRYIP